MSHELEIALSGGYSFNRLERLIEHLSPLFMQREPAVVHIDLRRLAPVGPTAIALLVAGLRKGVSLGHFARGTMLSLPHSPPVRNYLLRMNLIRALGQGDVDEPFVRKEPRGFRPCLQFSGGDDYYQVAGGLTDALTERCATDNVARAAILICLNEMAENVVHHAETQLGGFAAAQGWRKTQQFEVGIVDLGIGIRASLTRNQSYAHIDDDVTAITMALRPRVTATPERNAGIGLFVTNYLLAGNGGEMLVRSGKGAVYSGAASRAEQCSVAMPGTVVALRARTDRPLDINVVYQQLDELEQHSGDAADADDGGDSREAR